MAEFRLERFKYNWKGEWASDVSYKRDDIVRVSGKSYVCIIGHVSSNSFRLDLNAILPGSNPPIADPRWTVMTNGFSFTGDWTDGTEYNLGDIALYNGSLWICNTDHLSLTFADDQNNWTPFSLTTSFDGNWLPAESYAVNAVVRYNGNLYKCIETHNSQTILEDDAEKWTIYLDGVEWRDEWQSDTEYRINDFVKYGATVFRCTTTHESSGAFADANFSVELFGYQYESVWDEDTVYNVGDIVRHEGFIYYANNNNYQSRPYADNGSPDWILLFRSYNFKGLWTSADAYKTGDVVLRGGNLYVAVRDIADGQSVDGSTLDYLESDTWELLVPGKSWKGNWTLGNTYSSGDVIYYRGSSYVCNFEHDASFQNFPGDNGSGLYYWDVLIESNRIGGLEEKGDLLTYGNSRRFDDDGSTIFDDSTLGDTGVRIGTSEQVLSVSSDLEVFWRNITSDADSIYVSTNGVDDLDRGTFEKPFKSIRYATQYVQENFAPGSPVIIRVGTGKFYEVAPITVPAGCAINGDELRSTTVLANGPLPEYQNDYVYTVDLLDKFTSLMGDIVNAVESTPTVGNTEVQITEILRETTPDDTLGQSSDDGLTVVDIYPQGSIDKIPLITNRFAIYKNYIEFVTQNGDINPEVEGSNIENSDQVAKDTIEAIYINRKYIATELWAQLTQEYPGVDFSLEKIKTDVYSLISGIRRDIQYSGNYGTLIAAKVYANSVTGSSLESLFLMRDSTGLRDMTTGGLQGILNPPGVFDLYQKPTGGALVALDPGWGTEDERTWIVNRSPYIQGVTNTGTGCIGMKVDGALHAGGNKSMTANDFTQVLSDGIGAWITNNARAELVSVFTYYCQIGYFAEDGGIIRAANGNNSYGRYGSIADGIDETEVPQSVNVFNRNNEALISEAFAGGANDELFAFEYSNTGEQYSFANATIVGAGSNASVEYTNKNLRDDSIFELRLESPDGSSSAKGAGYLRRQGNAQELADASTSIKLAATDITQFLSEIQGMRLVVTDGLGVGQYGYVDSFDFATKTVTVRRETDGELGWDHIIPGTPLVASFDLTTRYRFEPRVVISSPAYNASSSNLFTNRSYVDMDFGTITETYTGVTAGGNVIWRDDNLTRITVSSVISNVALQFTAQLSSNPQTPFIIKGRTSGTQTTVSAISANTGTIIEVDIAGDGSNFIVGEEIDLILEAGTGNTFDGQPSASEFTVLRKGTTYEVTITNSGSGYSVGDKITISGAALGGETPANDLIITITEVSDDSTSSILNITTAGTGRGGRFVSLTSAEKSRYSDNGTDWTETNLPFISSYTKIIAGNDRFIALARSEDRIARSLNGVTWDSVNIPLSSGWSDGVYGNDRFVVIANDDDRVLYSNDGNVWSVSSIPNDTDGGLDSTTSLWQSITYGAGKYVAVSSSDEAVAISTDGINWIRYDSALPATFSASEVEYGNNRFVAVGQGGETAYSFDGQTWYSGQDVSALDPLITIPLGNNFLKYANGVFFMLIDFGGPGSVAYTSEYGINWTPRALPSTKNWTALAYGNKRWILKASAATTDAVSIVSVGAKAIARAEVDVGTIDEIRFFEPGSGYITDPTISIIDPNATFEVAPRARIGDKGLSQPSFINRGSGYRRSTSTITISGDGYADILPIDDKLVISGVVTVPGPGVQIQIEGVEDPDSLVPGALATFSGATVTDLGDDGTGNETRLVEFRIGPKLSIEYVVEHGTSVTLREKFSQCRISGHDFLDIGTGNFEQTNYPEIYSGGAFFTASPENEVYENNGGRVFYVSTDQDGNFRTGELFSVQQATGIVTISAQFFDLDGLSELALGGVRLGGSGAVVNEFSTDPTFAADSNNVVPTQRAIATFLSERLSVGGESLEVNKLQAGRTLVGGIPENELNTVTGQYLIIPSDVVIGGTYESDDGAGNVSTIATGISGTYVSQMFLLGLIDETMQ